MQFLEPQPKSHRRRGSDAYLCLIRFLTLPMISGKCREREVLQEEQIVGNLELAGDDYRDNGGA